MEIHRLIRIFFTTTVLASLWACQHKAEDIDLSGIEKSAHFIRFDTAFFNSDTAQMAAEIQRLSRSYPEFFENGTNLRFWKSQRQDPRQLELYHETQKVFTHFEALDENLNFSMKHFYFYFPNTPEIKFYSYISNLDFSYPVLYVPQNQLCFAALDLYLGPNKKYYKSQPEYQAYFRQPAFLVRDCLEAVSDPLIARKKEAATLLDDMVYYGRKLYILQKLLPQKDEKIIVQYPPDKLGFCRKNERSIWAYFVENKYLFDTSQDLKRRFIEIAPFSKFRMKTDNETPGMIGRWVGWQIVKAYMNENPSVSLEQLAKETDARKILKLSGYKP